MEPQIMLDHVRRVKELLDEVHDIIAPANFPGRDTALLALGRAYGVNCKVRDALVPVVEASEPIPTGFPRQVD